MHSTVWALAGVQLHFIFTMLCSRSHAFLCHNNTPFQRSPQRAWRPRVVRVTEYVMLDIVINQM